MVPRIDPEFKALIPPLRADERAALEESIAREGCRDPLVTWNGVLIDGHNRLEICDRLGVPYQTIAVEGVEDRIDARDWIRQNQVSRRNLMDDQRAMNAAGLAEDLSEQAKRDRARAAVQSREWRPTKEAEESILSDTLADKIEPEPGPLTSDQRALSASDWTLDDSPTADPIPVADMLPPGGVTEPPHRAILVQRTRVADLPPAERPKPQQKRDTRKEAAKAANVSERKVRTALEVKRKAPDLAAKVEAGDLTLAAARREMKRAETVANLTSVEAVEAKEAAGVYDVLVIDPPWPMKKIERDERPNQVEFDYPTMSEEELAALTLPAADDCHVWLWTTHKFLPMALRLLDAWGLKYVCTFVWHKPGGFQPIGLPQYNCEFAIYARKGSPKFVDTKAFPVCFDAQRGAHSEKPEDFYEVLRRVTAGRRLDMFNRRLIDGFDGWGKEAA